MTTTTRREIETSFGYAFEMLGYAVRTLQAAEERRAAAHGRHNAYCRAFIRAHSSGDADRIRVAQNHCDRSLSVWSAATGAAKQAQADRCYWEMQTKVRAGAVDVTAGW